MKRCILVILLLCCMLSGCASKRTDITQEEIIAAYEEAGYTVWSGFYDEKLDYGIIGYIRADHPNGDYIYFSIFETEEEAKAYKDNGYHPGMMGLFSAIFGDPSWQRWEVYGCMVVQYDDPEFYEVFEKLLSSK